jgi:hypothetical protein
MSAFALYLASMDSGPLSVRHWGKVDERSVLLVNCQLILIMIPVSQRLLVPERRNGGPEGAGD